MAHIWKRAAAAGFCASLAIVAFSAAAGRSAPEAVTVTMTDSRFVPATVHVPRGGSVTWRNPSELVHTVTSSGFDSGSLGQGATYVRKFDRPGTYDYHCTPHQAAGMVGRVIVDP